MCDYIQYMELSVNPLGLLHCNSVCKRRALRRVLLKKGVYHKPVLVLLPVFCRTSATTVDESNSQPATLQKRARETAKYNRSAQV